MLDNLGDYDRFAVRDDTIDFCLTTLLNNLLLNNLLYKILRGACEDTHSPQLHGLDHDALVLALALLALKPLGLHLGLKRLPFQRRLLPSLRLRLPPQTDPVCKSVDLLIKDEATAVTVKDLGDIAGLFEF